MPDDDPEERPGSAYLETMTAALPWAKLPVTVWDVAGTEEKAKVHGVHLVAEVLEALARYGLLVGEEHHHDLTDAEARDWAVWIAGLLPLDSLPGRLYGPTGHGIDGILTHAGLELCFPEAMRALSGEPREQSRLRRGRRALTRWMEERDRRTKA